MRMTKKITSIVLAVLMVVSMMSVMAISASAATTGSFGNLTWNIDDDGTLTFSGSGAIPMEAFEKNGDVKKVIINDSVTELGAYAFLGCPNLTEVDIQNPSVSLKGAQHFATAGVTTVTLPEGMTTIPYGMFRRCGALTTVDLPSTITRIEDLAFEGSGLQSISVPEGATYESNSFQTDSLQSLTLEGSSPMTFTGGEFTFLSDAATVFIPEGSTYVYSTTTLYVKDPSNWDAQEMLEYAQEDFNERIEFGSSPEEALAEVNDLYGDYYGITEPFTVTLNEGDKCEAVFGGATIGKYVPAPAIPTISTADDLFNACLNGGEYNLAADITTNYNYVEKDTIIHGKGHTIKSGSDYSVFYWDSDKDADLTLDNVTLDGDGKKGNAVDVWTEGSGNSANSGCNVTFDTVTCKNFVSAYSGGVGAVYLFGSSNGSFTDCTFDNNTVSETGANGFSGADIWFGGAGNLVISGGSYDEVYVNGGTASATVTGAAVGSLNAAKGSKIATDSPDKISVGEDYKLKKNDDGSYTVVPKVYVAQIGSTKYETLAEAVAAAQNGDTVKLLENVTLSESLEIPAEKNFTLDLNGKDITGNVNDKLVKNNGTVVVDDTSAAPGHIYNTNIEKQGNAAFVNYGTATVKNGYFGDKNSDMTDANDVNRGAGFQNEGTAVIDGGYFTACDNFTNTEGTGSGYAYAIINYGDITINDATVYGKNNGNLANDEGTMVVNGGTYTLTLGEKKNYYSIYNGSADADTTVNDGTFNNGATALTYTGAGSMDITGGNFTFNKLEQSTGNSSISGGTFSKRVESRCCAEGYIAVENDNGTFGVAQDDNPLNSLLRKASEIADSNLFKLNNDYYCGTLLGVQKKAAISGASTTSEDGKQEAAEGNDMRFVAVLETNLLRKADDYGFVLAKVGSDKNTTNTNFDNLKMGDDRAKTISAKGTYNNILIKNATNGLKYGDPAANTAYKYVTCAVNGVSTTEKVVARFYVTINGKTYYAKYAGHDYQYTGCTAGVNSKGNIV